MKGSSTVYMYICLYFNIKDIPSNIHVEDQCCASLDVPFLYQ